MGKISFPKHISGGRRHLRNSRSCLEPGSRDAPRSPVQPGSSPSPAPARRKSRQSRAPQGLGCSAQTCLSCHVRQSRRGKAQQSVDGGGSGAAQHSGPAGSASLGDLTPGPAVPAKLRLMGSGWSPGRRTETRIRTSEPNAGQRSSQTRWSPGATAPSPHPVPPAPAPSAALGNFSIVLQSTF